MKAFENASWPERLSALTDGETDAAETVRLADRWRDDAALQSQWHVHHLIGDVMRSDELTGRARDADFLAGVRARLAQEPVVMAPMTAPMKEPRAPSTQPVRPQRSALRWRAPAAVAAGFMMVAGALVVFRPATPIDSTLLSQGQPSKPPVSPGVTDVVPGTQPVARVDEPSRGVLIRDARMQQYFSAHQQFGGSLPSAFLRNATYDSPSAEAGTR